MTPERFKEVGRIYHEAVELDAAQRLQYLAEACVGDDALRAEVEALLSYDNDTAFLDRPALELATQILDERQARALAGRRLGHCELLSLLGKGGMGEVWLAEDKQLRRQVAVKLLPDEFTSDAARVRRFTQEARAASALNHPNILTIHEIGTFTSEAATTHYIVTEYVEGETLRERMRSAPTEQLPVTVAVEMVAQIAAALATAHEAGIIHRDIKPENLMVRRDGLVKVLDFGLAKLTETQNAERGTRKEDMPDIQQSSFSDHPSTLPGIVMGTPRYMSPEQARGEKVDARSDIFSLGAVLYEMVAGRPPFRGTSISEMIAAILRDAPPPLTTYAPAIPPALQRIVDQTLQKDRDARYQTMQELLADLKRLQRQLERQDELPDVLSRVSEDETTAILNGTQALKPAQSTNEQAVTVAPPTSFFDKIKRHKLVVTLTLMLLLSAVPAAVYFSVGRESAIDSLAVLPFVNVGANPDAEYLSDGITDSLINGLSQLPKLKVMSRNSVFRYKGKETDAQAAGNTLGVRAVLTGKVTQRGDDLIVSAELVDVRDNSHLWGEQYNRKLADLLSVQAALARDIAEKLRLKLSSAEQQRLTKHGTENAEAYDFYLKGRHFMNALGSDNEVKKGLEYFQRAVEKDPQFALAYAGLAEAYGEMGNLGTTFLLPPKEAFTKAKAAALKAVELDDTLAEAHSSLGRIAMSYEWDWANAEREFKRAIALNPNYVPVRHWYSHLLICLGRFDESLAQSQHALALDPLDLGMTFHLGFHYYNARQYDLAVAQFQKALAINQHHSISHGILGLVYAQQGRYDEAIAEIKKGMELGGPDQRGGLGNVYALAGQRVEAQKLLTQLQEEAKYKQVSALSIALIYAGLGEKEQAFAWLAKAIAERDPNITEPGLKVDSQLDNLRSDARFAEMLRRVGLAQ